MSDPIPTDTYINVVQKLTKRYKHSTTSSVVLFKNPSSKWGLGVYAPYILKKFFDNQTVIGADPTGLLFFDSLFDLEDDKHYKVFVNRATDPSEKAIVVQFYDETSDKFFAQFVARFRGNDSPPNFEGIGTWGHFDCALVSASIKKTIKERVIHITMNSVQKGIIITIPPGVEGSFVLETWDHILYSRSSTITTGTKSYVDYNDDRIVLYQDLSSKDANAILLPVEQSQHGGISFKSIHPDDLYAEWFDLDVYPFKPSNRI